MAQRNAGEGGSKKIYGSVKIIGSLFRLRRDLLQPIKAVVVPGSGLTLDDFYVLLDLYGASELRWDGLKPDSEGYVPLQALKRSQAQSQAILSRRIASFLKTDFVEFKRGATGKPVKGASVDRKSKSVRITSKGIELMRPLYDSYGQFCDWLLKDILPEDRENILRINEMLMKQLRWRKP